MPEAKKKITEPRKASYPKGEWELAIKKAEGNSVPIGCLHFVENVETPLPYVAAIKFCTDKEVVGKLADKSYPVQVQDFQPETGYIRFQVLGAATDYKPETVFPYRFFFWGNFKETDFCGQATIPPGFGGQDGLPDEDGDNVTWTSVKVPLPTE